MQLHQDRAEFAKRGLRILVAGPESASAFEKYWKDHQLDFIGIPDAKASVLKLYGQEINLFRLGRMPAQVLIDSQGSVRFVHYGHSMSDIPSNQEVFDAVDALDEGIE